MAGLDSLHPEFASRLQRLANAVGGLDWTSGYRSSQKQKQLYDCWRARRPGCAPANPPGTSNHEAIPYGLAQGLAMDIGRRNRDAARARAHEFGIHFPIPREPWHCQPTEARSSKFTGVPDFTGGAVVDQPLGSRFLRRTDPMLRGSDVAEWQRILGIADDGIFGPQTEAATRDFQRRNGLVDDGIVGPNTLVVARPQPAPPPTPPPPPQPAPDIDFRIIPRNEWGASVPKSELIKLTLPVAELWIHHTVTNPTTDPLHDAQIVQQVAFDREYADTSYCYLVHPDGSILEGRGLTVGAHTLGHNSTSIAFAYIGNYSILEPTPEALAAGRWLIDHLQPQALQEVHSLQAHRDNPKSPSECPGNNLYARLQELRAGSQPNPTPAPTPSPADWTEEMIMALPTLRRGNNGQPARNMQGLLTANGEAVAIDGDFGPRTERGLRIWQTRAGLEADAICGPKTWRALVGA